MSKIITKVEKFCTKHNLITPNSTLVIACSGGPDSLALVVIIQELNRLYHLNLELIVAHVEHQIRGQESISDSIFLEEFCQQRQLTFVQRSVNAPQFALEKKISIELAARTLRYEFLYEMACEHQACAIVTAHHQNDLAETVVQHLIRGSGSWGLQGIPLKNRLVIRPLLCLTREEIEIYCREQQLKPRFDSTNDSTIYQRNRIRKYIIPQLLHENPKFLNNISQTAQIISDEQDFLQEQAALYAEQFVKYDDRIDAYRLGKESLASVHIAIRRLLYRYILAQLQGDTKDISYAQVERIDALLTSRNYHQLIQLSHGLQVINTHTELIFSHVELANVHEQSSQKKSCISIANVPASINNQELYDNYEECIITMPKIGDIEAFTLPDGQSITIEMLTAADAATILHAKLPPTQLLISANLISGGIGCRYRRPGDKIIPKGMSGHKKIKAICIDKKIPQERRGKIPLLYNLENQDIIWFVGEVVSAKYPATNTCNKFLFLRLNN